MRDVHLREPGLTHKEDFDSGTKAAALGGVTTVLDMPTDDPWTATGKQLSDKMALAGGRLHVDVGFQAVIGRDLDALEALIGAAAGIPRTVHRRCSACLHVRRP